MPKKHDPIVIGTGLAAYGLATGILSRLNAKGLLSDDDVQAIYQSLLSDMEESGVTSTPEGRTAQTLLMSLATTAGKKSTRAN